MIAAKFDIDTPENDMSATIHIEKFAETDLAQLRTDLHKAGLDSFQAAELVAAFLSGRGYGVAGGELRSAPTLVDTFSCSVKAMQEELEKFAFLM